MQGEIPKGREESLLDSLFNKASWEAYDLRQLP